MRIISITLLIILALFPSTFAFTLTNWNDQEINSEEDIYRFYQEGSIGYFEYLHLLDIWENKIDINRSELEDLLDLPGIDENAAESIIKYRERTGDFSKITDLQKVPSLSKNIYRNIRNFISIYPFAKGGALKIKLEEDPLDDEGFYIYHNFQYNSQGLSFGYLIERDQEADNYSIENGSPKRSEEKVKFRLKKKYVVFRDVLGIQNFIAGNYTLRFGQGLVLGNSGRKNKIAELPDLSLYDKFYGLTGKLKIKSITLTPFYSKDKFNYNGLTDVYQEEIKGLNTRLALTHSFNLGATYYKSGINKNFDLDLNTYPDSNEAEVSGMDFIYKRAFLKFAGETAKIKRKGRGNYLELSYDLKDFFSLVSFRDYASDFYNPHSQPFAQEDDEPNDRDERGFYLESNFKFCKEFDLKTSFDQWSHPERKISDRELTGQVNIYPVAFFDLLIKHQARDEDLYAIGDKKIKDYMNGRFLFGRKFELAVFYGKDRNRNSDGEDILDDFRGYQVKLDNDKNIFLIRTKFSDDNVAIEGDKKKEFYFYVKLKEMEQTTVSFSFKAVHSSEDVFPNPEEIYRVVCDYAW